MRRRLLCLLLAAGMIGMSINAYAAEPAAETLEENIAEEEDELHRLANTVEINETNFPDEKFRQYILDKVDRNKDRVLSGDELKITVIDIDIDYGSDYLGYSDLKGIEFFQELQELYCVGAHFTVDGGYIESGDLESLDVSRNIALKKLDCSCNKLESLDVNQNIALEDLDCSRNKLGSLDVSRNIALKELDCSYNKLESLDVSKNTAMQRLWCTDNYIKTLDVRQNTALWDLTCDNNQLKELDVSQNIALSNFHCEDNQLSSLDVSRNTALTRLGCSRNQLRSLDVSNNLNLSSLDCRENHLGWLDLYSNTAIRRDYNLDKNHITFEGNQIDMSRYDAAFDPDGVIELENLVLEGNVFSLAEGQRSGTYKFYVGISDYKNDPVSMEVTLEGTVPGVAPTPDPDIEPTPAPQPTSKPTPAPSKDWTFTDVPENPGNWKYENVKFVNERGVMTGVNTNQFQPDSFLTRGQFASVIYRIAGSPKTTYKNVFTDVPAGKWYSNAVIWAYENKIVAGLGDGRYGVDDDITREQMARMLMELAKVLGYDTTARADFDRFADASQVSRWAAENMRWAVGSGIINGSTKDGKYYLNPKGKATRAECATMLAQFIKKHE